MLFHVSLAASQRIKLTDLKLIPSASKPDFLEEWALDLFQAEDKRYFLLTEGVSFYSMLFPAEDIGSLEVFEAAFNLFLKVTIMAFVQDLGKEDFRLANIRYGAMEDGPLRSLQCEQIDRVRRHLREEKSLFQINKIPLQELAFKTPEASLREEMIRFLEERGYMWIPTTIRN